MKFVVLLVVLLFCVCTGCSTKLQKFTLTRQPKEIDGVPYSNYFDSYCFIGIWRIPSVVHSATETCVNGTISWSTSNPYFVGNRDLSVEQLELYAGTTFGTQLFKSDNRTSDLYDLTANTRVLISFLLTGPSFWSLYEEPNQSGRFYCIGPAFDFDYNFSTDIRTSPYPNFVIKSIRKGCDQFAISHIPIEGIQTNLR